MNIVLKYLELIFKSSEKYKDYAIICCQNAIKVKPPKDKHIIAVVSRDTIKKEKELEWIEISNYVSVSFNDNIIYICFTYFPYTETIIANISSYDFLSVFMTETEINDFKNNLIKEEINDYLVSSCAEQTESAKISLCDMENKIKEYTKYLFDSYPKVLKLKNIIENPNLANSEAAKEIFSEIEKIKKHPLCTDISITNGNISVNTSKLVMYEPINKKYYLLGEMTFSIPFKFQRDINIININNKRRSYWGDKCQHPHISDMGTACFGNADAQLAQFLSQRLYYAVFITLINFCQTCDIHDCAGAYVISWDLCDENGNIIEQEEKDISRCAVCRERIPENELRETENGEFVCRDCAENYYVECDCCETLVHEDDAFCEDNEVHCRDCHRAYEEMLEEDCDDEDCDDEDE